MVAPLYNAEIAPPEIRGLIVGLVQLMIGIGFIAAQWIGFGAQFFPDDRQWRVQLGLQMAPALLLLIGIQFLPFSPVRPHVTLLFLFTSHTHHFCRDGSSSKREKKRRD